MNYRQKRPDKKKALSMINAAKKDMKFTLSLNGTEGSAPTIIRNIYESFRMLGESLLAAKGISSQDHIMPINELMKLRVQTSRPINLIDNLRRMRHKINYYGYSPNLNDVEYAISFAKCCFNSLLKAVHDEIENK